MDAVQPLKCPSVSLPALRWSNRDAVCHVRHGDQSDQSNNVFDADQTEEYAYGFLGEIDINK